MSYATSRPIVNRFFGGVDVSATLRTHLLANASDRSVARMRSVANSIRASVRVSPLRVARTMRRNYVRNLVLDLIN